MTGRVAFAVTGAVLAILAHGPAGAQSALIAGGLTALPPTNLGSNLLQNPGFEALSAGLPSGWSAGAGWSADQLVVHSGSASYRRTTGATTSFQRLQLRVGTYFLSAWIKTDILGSGTTSGVRLTLDFRAGGINAWTPSDVISGTNDWKLYQIGPIVVDTDRTADVKLENYNGASGTAWFDDVRLVQILPQPVDVFLLYPNYRGMLFDDQPQTIRLDVTVTPPAGDFARYSVRAVLADEASGQVAGQQSLAAAPQLVATLDGSVMQSGRGYLATVSLVDLSTNAVVASYPAYRVSRVTGSARQSMNVSFDAKNRVLLRGVPRFVLGVYDSGLGYSADPAFWENTLWSETGPRRMNGLGINMYINYWYGQAPTDAMSALMANLQQHGVAYLQTGNCFDTFPTDPTFPINSSDAYVQTIGAQAGSAGYYTIDECQGSLQPAAFSQYQRLRQLDPDSMTFAALLGDPQISLWRDSADVLSSDPYPLFGAEPAGGYNLAQVADWTARTRAAVKDARPFMTVLQFFKFTSQGRFPTLAEMRNMAYMAIVEGASGLWWWSLGSNALQDVCSGWCADKTTYMANLKSVVNEVAALEPMLLADDSPGALVTSSNTATIRTKVKVVGGRGYVFAYNYTGTPQSASFTWNTAPGTVTVNGEGRTLLPTGAVFTDTFGPFQAHVYVLANGGGASASPLALSFTSPIAGATVSATVSVAVTAGGGSGGGYTYTIAVDGGTISTGTRSSVAWDTTTVGNGAHTLTATVRDSSGATATASRSVTVSNASTPPPPPLPSSLNVAITQPTAGTTVSGTAWAVVWLEGASGSSNAFNVTLGGVALGSTVSSSAGPVSIPYNTAVVANGTQTLAVSATDATGKSGASSVQVVVSNNTAPALSLSYGGKLRDRVGQSATALSPDGALDGTLTVTLTGSGGRTVTALRLDSTGPGTWDTDGASAFWALGVATTTDGALLNDATTTAVNFFVADGGTFVLFASDYANIEFVPGATLTLRATFSDGTSATATTTVTTPALAPPPPSSASLSLAYTGKSRDRVGQGNAALAADGAPDGTLTVTLNAGGGRTVTRLRLDSSGPGIWDTDGGSPYWALGVATSLDGPLVNSASTMAVNLAVPDGGSLVLFASDYANIEFVRGATLTVTATFADGTTATAATLVP